MTTQFLRPVADSVDGGWTNETDGGTLYTSLDETTAADADYIKSSASPSADACKIKLASPSGTVTTPMTVGYRFWKDGTDTIDLIVRLLQGATVIASKTETAITTTHTDGMLTLTAPEFAAITDFTDLYLQFEASVAGVAYTGPGDVVGSADAWWGLRAYSSASIGANAVRLRESGGNTEQDFATIAGGGLDLAAISTFKGANNLFVVKLYDQVGTNHLEQATSAAQPAFTLSGLGSLPTIDFDGSNDTLVTGSAVTATANSLTFSTTAKFTGADTGTLVSQANVAHTVGRSGTNTVYMQSLFVGGPVSATAADGSWHALQAVLGTSGDLNVDGSANAGTANALNGSGAISLAPDFPTFSITEFGVWQSLFSGTQSSNMSANQHSYWDAPWTPADLGSALIGWWKADTGVTTSSGNVTAVADQSGNGKTLTNSGVVPFNATGLNGLPAFDFVASNNAGLKNLSFDGLGTGTTGSAFFVGTMRTGTDTNGGAISYTDNNGAHDYNADGSAVWIAREGSGNGIQTFRNFNFTNGASVALNTNYRIGAIFTGVRIVNYIDNTPSGTDPLFSGAWGNTATNFYVGNRQIGGSFPSGAAWDGCISEIVITNTALSSGDRALLDAYFVAKWGF